MEYPLSHEGLIQCVKDAEENNAKYIGVKVFIKGYQKEEIIINHKDNFNEKLNYYLTTYDKALDHKYASGISIVKFAYGDTFAEIEEELMGGK